MAGLKDKSIIIAGGASGIGKAAALAAAAQGARLTIADLDEIGGGNVADAARAAGAQAQFVRVDIANREEV